MSDSKEKAPQQHVGIVPDLRKVPLEAPDDGVFFAYGNVVNMNWTLTDVQLRFGELIQVPNDEDPSWENQHGILLERVAVTIPWYQAKVLLEMLGKVVHNYESLNGELKAPQLAEPPKD